MARLLTLLLLGVAVWAVAADAALAQSASAWPNYPLSDRHVDFPRGPGFYVSIWKVLAVWLLFLGWVKTTDWVGQDVLRLRLDYTLWNPVVFFPFMAALVLFWILPSFWLGFPLLVIAYAAPLISYIVHRNAKVLPHQKVLTPDHLRHVLTAGKVKERKLPGDAGPPVKLTARGGKDEQANQANMIRARQSPGIVTTRELLADALDRRAEGVLLDYSQQGVAVRYQIDGVWHNVEPREREPADLMLAVIKTLAALDSNQRRAKQQGELGAEYQGVKYTVRITSQGVETGERVLLHLVDKRWKFTTLEELGMRPKTQEQLKQLLAQPKGFVLFSSPPQGGLTTLIDVALKACDRYMRDFIAVEEVDHREHDIENLHIHAYNAKAGEKPMTLLPKLARTYPNVFVLRELPDGETVKFLCEQVEEDRMVISGIRAKEAAEALLRVLMLKVPPSDFAPAVIASVNCRLIRKLCDACKEAYAPPPELLKQLGLPEGRVEALFRPPTVQQKQPCKECQGIGYKGRTGLFELLAVDDNVRQVLMKSPKLELLRAAARKAGMRTLQEEGLILVVKGTTSVQELLRVLKG